MALAASGCSASEGGTSATDTDQSSGGTTSGTGGEPGSGAGGDDGTFGAGAGTGGSGAGNGGADTENGCIERASFVYVLSQENELYSFRPDRKEFTRIGVLGCQTDMQPNSMAVDRDAVAWVNYVYGDDSEGTLFKVSTEDASCEPTGASLSEGWARLGMGFSSDLSRPDAEELFVAGTTSTPGIGLGKIDGTSVTPVGEFSGRLRGESAELTGTGDGRLFGFFTTSPVQLAEIDKETGEIIKATPLPGIETPSAWAFSFWGGDFYFYTAPDQRNSPSRTTNVSRYRPSDGSIDTAYMTNIGFRIVGAGVSTCAPVEQPR
ncbi:hypothetical protein BE17_09800 [Sorangium cellulosum]|uniref:Uncharacterized protein n=1 Tax=Sorangium cellulosum TaxID=56 RepID=A0A150SLS9_SORCE|nr:hypothetical protein BE17_09800 [Sorangium cellulosum]